MKSSASLSLAISATHYQDARSGFMNERYIKGYTPWLSQGFEMLGYAEMTRRR
jgi:hypothetical protein